MRSFRVYEKKKKKEKKVNPLNSMWEIFKLKKPQKCLKFRITNQKTHNIQDTKLPALMEEMMIRWKVIMLENMKYQD